MPNRGHGILLFGGVQEGENIILHLFDAGSTVALIPRWVFHDIQDTSYSWYAESSRDRGKTWNKTWLIDGTRRGAAVGTATASE